ncbi:hypothetical protein EYS14_22285 [Alteromonadaceae bacterium M269]|nr:hypothetical protein EYS14_22285 [Alteromonadaceae bacterium M269]
MKKILFFVLALTSFNSLAAFNCTVTIKRVLIYANGAVNVLHTGRNDYTVVCNLGSEYKGVGVTTCAMWAGMLQNIQENKSRAGFYYNGEGSCATLPVYGNAPAPVYIGTIEEVS